MSGLERDGVHAAQAQAALDLAPAFAAGNADAAGLGKRDHRALHARLTAGLVAPERTGMLRRGPRVVHDASVGRIIHFPTEPQHLAAAWEGLLRSLTAHAAPHGRASQLSCAAASCTSSSFAIIPSMRRTGDSARAGRAARSSSPGRAGSTSPLPLRPSSPRIRSATSTASRRVMRRGDATAWIERWGRVGGRVPAASAAPPCAAVLADSRHTRGQEWATRVRGRRGRCFVHARRARRAARRSSRRSTLARTRIGAGGVRHAASCHRLRRTALSRAADPEPFDAGHR
jgi:hypothetical protein